jgi:hypothetical protein
LFQEFDFEVVVKSGKHNVGLDHLSRMESRESGGNADDDLLDVYLFRVEAVPYQFKEIVKFLTTIKAHQEGS